MLVTIFVCIFRELAHICRDFVNVYRVLLRFPHTLPGFSPNQNFWGCACILASYTNGQTNVFILIVDCAINLVKI